MVLVGRKREREWEKEKLSPKYLTLENIIFNINV